MKKMYIAPVAREIKIENRGILMGSFDNNAIKSNKGDIKYGGVDLDGTLDPGARDMGDYECDE